MVLDNTTIARWLTPLPLNEQARALVGNQEIAFDYRAATAEELAALRSEVEGFIENDSVIQAGPKRRADWERGWQENLDALSEGEALYDSVKPKYFRENHWHRIDGELAWFENPFTEYEVLKSLREPLYLQVFEQCQTIVEFGCGSGQNLLDLAGLFPGKEFVGFDWVESSARLVESMGQKLGCAMRGAVFDMENPSDDVRLAESTGILTYHAFEQLGDRFGPMLDYLLSQPAAVIVQVEPIAENYDLSNEVDELAYRYHNHRCYLSGYLGRLHELERAGEIEIVSNFRIPFGSRFHEANGVVVWKRK